MEEAESIGQVPVTPIKDAQTKFSAIAPIKISPLPFFQRNILSIGRKPMRNWKKKKPEDSFKEYSGFRVVRRFITGIINPF
ncbi:hypothetical protein EHQ83_02285 [Leptospira yasudae]|uniref:Uncharacterized protein n=1 Tax=Leptospira yasudae TaxID=2202201 RepID=A0A6N4QUX8_9LEPT|nr:hypothetical protein EHQ72_17625 [Leptospira yasudae]TGL82294.1 hypothetical protein EHQ77_04350 [Leptospira yasudae]TGL89035.1 hypothetical protein EHQ83_02285 [Leptospira yasudae]